MDLSTFDFRTGKMLMNKMNKSRQRVRYDSSNQVKVRTVTSAGGGPPGLATIAIESVPPLAEAWRAFGLVGGRSAHLIAHLTPFRLWLNASLPPPTLHGPWSERPAAESSPPRASLT